MTMKYLHCSLYIVLIFISTTCDFQSAQLNELNESYSKFRESYKPIFVDHFPEKIAKLPAKFYNSRDTRRSHPGFRLRVILDWDEISKIQSHLKTNAKAIYKSEDDCLLLIDAHITEENRLKFDKNLRYGPVLQDIDRPCHANKYPVPKFWQKGWNESDETLIGLKPGYILYVIEAESGIFLDRDKLPNGKYTPFGWEHGFTKGIAINKNEKSVIYWFDIW